MAEVINMENKSPIDSLNKNSFDSEALFEEIINMPDEDFIPIAPMLLKEIEKNFNEESTLLSINKSVKESGLSYEELIAAYKDLMIVYDELDVLSKPKKEFFKTFITLFMNAISKSREAYNKTVSIPIELSKDATLPKYAHLTDAAVDLYATEDYELKPGEQVMVHTGIKMAIPNGYAVLIQPRSGLSAKTKLRICNTPGLIDAGYRGEICVLVENVDAPIYDMTHDEELGWIPLYGKTYNIEKGERIAQARLVEVPQMAFVEVENIGEYESDRGEGGFGSSGMK